MSGDSTVHDSATSAAIPVIVTFNPAAQLPLKLTPTNFASWRSQFETLLMGLDLFGFIDGSTIAPSRTITMEAATQANPAYQYWFRQDKLILHALRCSISESIYSFVSAASTSREAWLILEKLYASSAQSRVIHLKTKLAKTVKGDNDVLTFVNDLKSLAAELALVNAAVAEMDLVVLCLRGLGDEYAAFSAAVRARGPGLTLEDLVDSLVEYESDLKAQARHSVPTAFYTHPQQQRQGGGGASRSQQHRGFGTSPRFPSPQSRPASPRAVGSLRLILLGPKAHFDPLGLMAHLLLNLPTTAGSPLFVSTVTGRATRSTSASNFFHRLGRLTRPVRPKPITLLMVPLLLLALGYLIQRLLIMSRPI
ncbi:unnamed protein product [Linum trigynum]|uniref:Retrotransposon Copia-like N-terminal domain-containing protein n=1 Tax=Linum trigynum TaxID=586398 RepID=A0AAV2CZ03_9ROSI